MWLKKWQGVTSGTFMGRDDGHPETKYRVYSSIEELAKDFGKCRDEEYYVASPVSDPLALQQLVDTVNEKLQAKKEYEQRMKDVAELERLKAKLNEK